MGGPGSSEVYVAAGVTQSRCVEICLEKRNDDTTINGATTSRGGGKCYCEKNGSQIYGTRWETCYLPDLGK